MFSSALVMVWDQRLWDSESGCFTVHKLLDQADVEFSGWDLVVLWNGYPQLGFDRRNQFDFFRELPGGATALAALVGAFQERGVRVVLPYNPWDTGTRREQRSDLDLLLELVHRSGADGVYLDTLASGVADIRARLDSVRPGLAVEGELALPVDRVADHQLSWGQWFDDGPVPGVVRNAWFEQRHLVHLVRRWDTDHSGELQTAFMNGSGIVVWENVFGFSVDWTPRDRSILRAMLPIQRRFADHFAYGAWTPLVETVPFHVYASLWELEESRLWTLVNRSPEPYHGPLLQVGGSARQAYVDLVHGYRIRPEADVLHGILGGRGVGAFLAPAASEDLEAFLEAQRHARRRDSDDATFRLRTETAPARTLAAPRAESPNGMVTIEAANVTLTSVYRARELTPYEPPWVLDAVQPAFGHTRSHTRAVQLGRYAIDRAPVTNADFRAFLERGSYDPHSGERFLDHWPAADVEPVVYVDLDDARAYAAWVGKRLPTDEEWQYAFQQAELDPGSPRVWNWTESEKSDGYTRSCLLKGGSDYQAEGSHWYADGGPKDPDFTAKFVLSWPALDRCATIGFRCVADLEPRHGTASPRRLRAA
jgi:formylglycine-generating enzyme required for sulfatase activity